MLAAAKSQRRRIHDTLALGTFQHMIFAILKEMKAYFDESTDGECRRVFVIAGYLADDEEWEKFSQRWRNALDEEGLEEYHAKENSTARPEDIERQQKFLQIIAGHKLTAIGIGIILEPYNALLREIKTYRKIPSGLKVSGSVAESYFLAFQHAIESAASHPIIKALPAHEKVEFVFDDHRHFKGRADALHQTMLQSVRLDFVPRISSLSFGDSKTTPPLQAADALAYEFFHELNDRYLNQEPGRWQWKVLTQNVPREQLRLLDKKQLEDFVVLLKQLAEERIIEAPMAEKSSDQ